MLKVFGFISLAWIIINGCGLPDKPTYELVNDSSNKKLIRKTYHDGNLLVKETLSLDTIRNGDYIEYRNGNPWIIGKYLDGNKEGKWVVLNLNGDTTKIENWFNGKRFGELIIFNERNNFTKVKSYSFFNLRGQRIFHLEYNNNGDVAKLSGIPIYFAYNKAQLKINEQFELLCFVGIPNKFDFNLRFEEIDKITNKTISIQVLTNSERTLFDSLEMGMKYSINKSYSNPGKFKWNACLKMKYLDSIVVKEKCYDFDIDIDGHLP